MFFVIGLRYYFRFGFTIHVKCKSNASQMYGKRMTNVSECVPNICQMDIKCMVNVIQMYGNCAENVR